MSDSPPIAFVSRMLLKGSLALAALAMGAMIAGFLREVVIAARFGANRDVDAYLVAALLPTFLASVFTSTVGGTVVPVFQKAGLDGEHALDRYVSALWTASVVVLLAGAVTLFALVQPLVRMSAPGFDEAEARLAGRLAVVLLPSGVMAGLSGCLGALLNARKHFVVPALVSLLSTAAVAVSALTLVPQLGVFALGVGSLVGSALGLAFAWGYAVFSGIRVRLGPVLSNEHVRLTARLSVPLLVGAATTFGMLFVDRAMASSLPPGSIAALGYADKVVRLPEAIFMLTLPTVLFPYLSEASAAGDSKRVSKLSNMGVTFMIVVLVPVALVFSFFARPIVSVVFARGEFGSQDIAATASALVGYAFGVVFSGLGYVFPRILLALRRSAVIGLLGCLNVVLKIGLNHLLVPVLGHQGIALASTLTYLITDVAFVFAVWRCGVRLHVGLVLAALSVGTLVGVIAVGSAYAAQWASWADLAQLSMAALGGGLALIVTYRSGALTRILEARVGDD